jgi:NADP-dependent 3-hydroxy acid dehydrogenase YdfG
MTKTIFITGASSGVGEATAKLFAAKGWNVVAASRPVGKFESGQKMLPLSLDVTDKEAIAEAIEKTRHRFGGVDVLVNDAGIGMGGPLEAVTDQQLRAVRVKLVEPGGVKTAFVHEWARTSQALQL